MSDENDKLGTPEGDAGDAAEQARTTGAPTEDGRGGLSAEDTAKLHLSWKAKAERADALEAEIAELKERMEQSPAAPGAERDEKSNEEYWEQVAAFAAKGDPVARAQIAERQERVALERNMAHLYQLQEIEDKAEREEVRKHFAKNRHRLGDPQAARAEIRERKYAEENAKLREELKKATVKNDPDVVRTHSREVPASQHKTRMTAKEWANEQKNLPPLDRMARQRALNEGKIVVED